MKKFAASLLLFLTCSVSAQEIPVILQDTNLKDFVTWYTQETGQSVIVSPGADARLTVYSPSTPIESLPELFRAVIHSHGLQIEDGTPLVISKPVPVTQDPVVNDDTTQDLVTHVHRFQNVLADDLKDFSFAFIQYQSPKKLTKQPSVHVIRSINALAITTTDDQQEAFATLMTHLDTPRPLIHIEAVIVEHSDNAGFELGISSGQSQLTQGIAVGGFELGKLAQLQQTGFTFGILNDQQLAFALHAIQSDVNAQILSKPQILIMSGEEGVISVGQNVPFIGSTTQNSTNTTRSIERRDVGISLTVRPFISQQGQIILALTVKADSINQSLQASDIITNTRNIRTTVQLQAGQSISLGGLITTEEEERVRKVPLLGSIPFLGVLFRSTSTQTTQRELNIILRATNVNSFSPDVPTL